MRISSPDISGLALLSENEWTRALHFMDRARLTLTLGTERRDHLPEWVRERIDGNLHANARRFEKTKEAFQELASQLQVTGLECLVLKGFSQWPYFIRDPRQRVQYDLDLYVPPQQVHAARDAALKLGYEAAYPNERRPTDHLPTMIRKTGWQWRDDFFDTELPLSLELHFQFWDGQTEGFSPLGLDRFWERRSSRQLEDLSFTGLHRADAAGYAALHLLRHLLRGDIGLYHAYELARMLDANADDDSFWLEWTELHDPSLRRLEAICFSLVNHWFGGQLPAAAREEIERLPAETARWLRMHRDSPLHGLFRPNKDELWLHWNLAESTAERLTILRRRLLPAIPPGHADAVHIPDAERTPQMRLKSRWRHLALIASRTGHHARGFVPTLWSGIRWFGGYAGFGGQFWRFFVVAGFYDFGIFIFFLLYNLYLVRLGFAENVIGYVSSALTAGRLVGSIPAALAMERFGARKTLFASFLAVAADCGLRASATTVPLLIALSFIGGLVWSVWAVAFSPVIAQLTNDRNRTLGFSLMFARGITTGIFAGFLGGRFPEWLERAGVASSPLLSYRLTLWVGSAVVLLALWPLAGLQLEAAPARNYKIAMPTNSLKRFFGVLAVWHLGTAMFNPFFNTFLLRQNMSAAHIGSLVSVSQAVQVVAILFAPVVFRAYGRLRGIAGMQFATAAALIAMAGAPNAAWAGAAYVSYMAVQFMSEPGLYGYLMDVVAARDRGAASALNFLVAFAAQAAAAAVAGALIFRLGYSPVLRIAAGICAAAAILFGFLLEKPAREQPADP